MPKRFIWAVDVLDLQPSHQVLEIGCGVGLMAELMSNKLQNGKLIAVDKSSFMIKKAKLRNKPFIASGVATLLIADFLKADLQHSAFDVITAFNLNFFKKDSATALQRVKQFFKPGGKLFIFFQEPYEITISAADPIAENLSANGFIVLDTKLKEFFPTSAICIAAVPE